MSEQDDSLESPAAKPGGDAGLFSQLPRTRPGTRSPRRASGSPKSATGPPKARKPAAMRAASAKAKPAAAPKPPPRPRNRPVEPSGQDAAREADKRESEAPSGIEELAWAGIAVTAEAATLGVRLLGRAFDAARKATERPDRG